MTPAFLVRQAKESGLDMIGITDHNSTLQCAEIKRIGDREGVFVLCGAEVTTQEEVHCLAFMEDMEKLELFQEYLSEHLPPIKNKPELFGYQLVVNEQEEVLEEYPYLLISAISQTIDRLEQEVHRLNGLFIPAHIDKQKNSLMSQLGFVPPDLQVDALEISWRTDPEAFLTQHPELKKYAFTSASDAHYPDEFSRRRTLFRMENLSFDEVRKALHGEDGRTVELPSR
jgi:PHP family Zn ribbon phosphoesterase